MRISNNTADTITVCLALCGVLAGVTLAFMVAIVFIRHTFYVPLYDQSVFILLSFSGVYSLIRFIVKSR